MITGIIVALPEELSTLTKEKFNRGNVKAISGDILLALSGTGPENAKNAADKLIERGAGGLISWCCAAALIDSLKPGDLVLAGKLIAEDGGIYNGNAEWKRHVNDLLAHKIDIISADLVESSKIVQSSAEKASLQRLSGAVIVDMESTAIAKIAANNKLPFVAIRAVADPANMALPEAVAVSLDRNGEVQIAKLLRHLLTHPFEIPALIKLGLAFNAAKKTLRIVARQLDTIVGYQSSLTLT